MIAIEDMWVPSGVAVWIAVQVTKIARTWVREHKIHNFIEDFEDTSGMLVVSMMLGPLMYPLLIFIMIKIHQCRRKDRSWENE
jgi:hypothetical protein